MIDYVSLHNHTTFSIMDGLVKPVDLFKRAKELGQTAIAVTDHGTLAGAWDSLKAAKKVGIKLIIGCEMYFVEDVDNQDDTTLRHLILLAKNSTGYRNLLTLNKVGYDNFVVAYKKALPRIDWRMLEQYHEGLICTTACGNGVVSQRIMAGDYAGAKAAAERLQIIFGDDLALELQPHALRRQENGYSGPIDQMRINLALKRISEETGIRCIAASDTHYLDQADHDSHDVLLAIGSGQPKYSGQRLTYGVKDFYVKNAIEIGQFFLRWRTTFNDKDPDFIEKLFTNTVELASRCEEPAWIDPKHSNPSGKELPQFPVQQQEDYDDFLDWKKDEDRDVDQDVMYLRYRCDIGLKKKLEKGILEPSKEAEYRDRIQDELEVLEFHGFSSYMLIVADYVEWALRNDIPVGPGRGSVGGSFVAYLIDIHKANPFRYGLIFARFHNKAKTSFPDIDLDFAPTGRAQVQDFIRRKYGEEYVAHVSNVNTITPKVYARDIARTFEFGDEDRSKAAEIGDEIADSISGDIKTVEKALEEAPLFAEYAKQYPQLAEHARLIGGRARAWSTHAGGIVIGKRPLTGLIPVRRDPHGQFTVEYDKERAEDNGLVKMDTLGLETLDIIQDTGRIITECGKTPPPEPFDYEQEDEKTYDLISAGNTFCVFQLGGMATSLCRAVKPKTIEDISLVNALVRPSAKTIVNDLIKVRNGETQMELMHPILYRAFAGTYGFGLYEECLMYLAQDVAGWDLHSADRLRKMTKEKGKNPKKVAGWRTEFIEDAQKNKKLSAEIATRIWDEVIAGFGGYGFNMSHSTLYSMISFHTAYLKANFPLEFLVANLMSEVRSNAKAAKDNILRIKDEIRQLGVRIVPPDLNTSKTSYHIVDQGRLMTGLDSLKYMGKDAIPELVAKRPFQGWDDFLSRIDAKKVRAPAIQALAASGSLDDFGIDRKLMFYYAADYRKKLQVWMKKDPEKRTEKFEYPWPEETPWTVTETYALEEYYMGEGIAGTVYERYEGFFDDKVVEFPTLAKIMPYKKASDNEKEDRKGNTHFIPSSEGGTENQEVIVGLKGIITTLWSFKVKKEDSKIFGQVMARLTVQDPMGNDLTVLAFPDAWENMQERVKMLSDGKLKPDVGLAIFFNGAFQWENKHQYSFILSDIVTCKGSPALPADLKARKVRMPRAKRVKKKDVEELSKEELLDKLEDELIEQGTAPIDDEDDAEDFRFDPFNS